MGRKDIPRVPRTPVGAEVAMEREPMRETVKQALGSMTQMFVQQREHFLRQAMLEMGLNLADGWKYDLDTMEFVRPAKPKAERKKVDLMRASTISPSSMTPEETEAMRPAQKEQWPSARKESKTFLTDTVATPASDSEEDIGCGDDI